MQLVRKICDVVVLRAIKLQTLRLTVLEAELDTVSSLATQQAQPIP